MGAVAAVARRTMTARGTHRGQRQWPSGTPSSHSPDARARSWRFRWCRGRNRRVVAAGL